MRELWLPKGKDSCARVATADERLENARYNAGRIAEGD